ncbi:MAG: hypothetical protein HY645_04295 [Acidobacteria bacterium]|nr:hypothetical protein [Acidobacteriota bacterium]
MKLLKFESKESRHLLTTLLAVDTFFILLHLGGLAFPSFSNVRFLVHKERGYAECFQYGKELALAACFLLLALRLKQRQLLFWSAIFGLFFVDDSFQIHEMTGRNLSRYLKISSSHGLRAVDFGELMMLSLAGICLAALLGIVYLRGSPDFRRIAMRLVPPIAGFTFLAVVVDLIHSRLRNSPWNQPLALMEDGGELVVLSLVAALVWDEVRNTAQAAGGTLVRDAKQ